MLLAAIMLLLTACGQTTTMEQSLSPSPSGLEQVRPPRTGQATVQTPEKTDDPNQSAQPSDTQMPELFEPTATVEEMVLVDEGDVKITATGIKYTAYQVKVGLTIENNTEQSLSFHAGTMGYNCNSINGYMVDGGYLNTTVAAGKKTNETVSFGVDELTLLGIADIADIELGFSISDDHYNDYLVTGPRQLKTSLADSYDYAVDTYRRAITDSGVTRQFGFTVVHDLEDVLFNQRGIRVVSQTLVENSSGEQVLLVEVENTSDDMVYVSVGDVALNGLGVESGTWSTDWVGAGKRRLISVPLSYMLDESYGEVFGINEIGSVSYSFGVKDIDRDTLVVPPTLTFSVLGRQGSYDASGQELYQADGVRIVFKGLAPDAFEYSEDVHVLLLVENNFSRDLSFDVDYDSVSVNGYMTDFICYRRQVSSGGSAVLDVELWESSLEENGIAGLEDITEVEFTVEIRNDSYKTVAEPVVRVNVGE